MIAGWHRATEAKTAELERRIGELDKENSQLKKKLEKLEKDKGIEKKVAMALTASRSTLRIDPYTEEEVVPETQYRIPTLRAPERASPTKITGITDAQSTGSWKPATKSFAQIAAAERPAQSTG